MNENPKEQTATLTPNDLADLQRIVDVAVERGAFKPAELVAVGTAYNKLAQFIQISNAAQAKAQVEKDKESKDV